jgi:hypothetical protein
VSFHLKLDRDRSVTRNAGAKYFLMIFRIPKRFKGMLGLAGEAALPENLRERANQSAFRSTICSGSQRQPALALQIIESIAPSASSMIKRNSQRFIPLHYHLILMFARTNPIGARLSSSDSIQLPYWEWALRHDSF